MKTEKLNRVQKELAKLNWVQKELAVRWGCSIKTVRRDIKRFGIAFGIRPVRLRGLQPIFTHSDVLKIEQRRTEARLRTLGYLDDAKDDGAAIITIRKAKAIARRGRK